ncbi:MAG: bifunctional diguanylate cyclase/phosphodiesterase [Alphaproteobacteria bacterium]|nr:MAG: bifunctional diguanylate cyclase/phosphodiesterase [Alphaproteobacteria bacterium]
MFEDGKDKNTTDQANTTTIDYETIQKFLSDMGEAAYHWDTKQDNFSWISNECKDFSFADGITDMAAFQTQLNPQDAAGRQAFLHELSQAEPGTKRDMSYRIKAADGRGFEVRETATVARDESGNCYIYGRIQPHKQVENFEKDKLTGLYLRQWFLHRIAADNNDVAGHVLAIGIDRLAMYNEAFGAHVTDEIIRGVAERLGGVFQGQRILARVSGDIFGVALPGANAEQVSSIVAQLLASFRSVPVETAEGRVHVTVSAGGAAYNNADDLTRAKDLMVQAETALQEAKRGGRGRYMSYIVNDKQREQFRTWLKTSDTLLTALGGNRLVLAFQPIIAAKTGQVKFYETLVRMVDADGKLVAAGEFMPVVEQMGIARLVDQCISKMALEELKTYPDLTLSINISAWTLDEPTWLRYLLKTLRETPEIAERLIVEITETVALSDMGRARSFVRTLQALGARVALDDFGTGNTSFRQIKELGVDIVKIDKSFVRRMATTYDNRLFVQTLQKLAEGCSVETVGEGAETAQEVEMLQKDGITYIQGYAYGFPSVERLWLGQDDTARLPDNVRALQGTEKKAEQPSSAGAA